MEGGNKNGKIQIFAKNITGRAKGEILEEANKIKNYAGGKHIQNGITGGVNNGSNQPRKPTEDTEVKTIECIDQLDDGSANDGSGINIKKGIVFGKNYTFKVKNYTKDTPKNLSNIRWALSYKNPETGIYYENILSRDIRGETIRISFAENTDICGCEMEIKAYISNINKEGNLKVWHHNRFRWFDGQILINQLEERKSKPWLANQNETPTCGMAAIMYILAKKDFEHYKNFILTLHRKGVANCNNYTIDVDESKHLLEINPAVNKKYPSSGGKMPYADWIPFSCIRDKENEVKDYNGENDESFDGSTVPRELTKLMKEILGFTSVTDNTNVVFNKGTLFWDGEDSSSREVAKMQKLYLDGYSICMLINANMLSNKRSGIFTPIEHWVVFEGIIGETITPELYDYEVFTWGELRKVIIDPNVFRTNYYGYVYGK